jgi:hypothetical protein
LLVALSCFSSFQDVMLTEVGFWFCHAAHAGDATNLPAPHIIIQSSYPWHAMWCWSSIFIMMLTAWLTYVVRLEVQKKKLKNSRQKEPACVFQILQLEGMTMKSFRTSSLWHHTFLQHSIKSHKSLDDLVIKKNWKSWYSEQQFFNLDIPCLFLKLEPDSFVIIETFSHWYFCVLCTSF